MDYEPKNQNTVQSDNTSKRDHVALISIAAVVILSIVGYFFYANYTNQPVLSTATVEHGYDSTKAAVMSNRKASELADDSASSPAK